MAGKRGRSGGARRNSGRKMEKWQIALIRKRNQIRIIPYKLDCLENVIKNMDVIANWVAKNEMDTGRALTINSIMRTQVEILIPTEQQMKVKVLEDKVTRYEKLLGTGEKNEQDRRTNTTSGTSGSSGSSTVDNTEQNPER